MTDQVQALTDENRRLREENARLQQQDQLREAENQLLLRQIADLTERLAKATDTDRQQVLALELNVLNERLKERERALFGSSSERRPKKMDSPEKKRPRKPRSKHGRTAEATLPVQTCSHHFDAPDLTCPTCGHGMRLKSRKEGYKQIEVQARRYFVQHHEADVASCGSCGHTEAADTPPSWKQGSGYSSDVAIQVAYDKYGLHQPLARQEREMNRQGVEVRRNTLAGLLGHLVEYFLPSYHAIHADLLSQPVVHADETRWRMMPGKGGATTWWVWGLSSDNAAYFTIQSTRSKKAAHRLLVGYAGIVVADAYGAYAALERLADRNGDLGLGEAVVPNFDLAGCWSHARRGVIHATAHSDASFAGLDLIDAMFAVDRRARDVVEADPSQDLAAVRGSLRTSETADLVDALYTWCRTTARLPGSQLDKAIGYLTNQKTPLRRFLSDGRIPMTNNRAERNIRGPVLGRKNHQGSRSEGGTRIASVFYTIVGSCRAVGADPYEYMRAVVDRGMVTPGYALLPRDFAVGRAREGQPPES